MAQQATFEYDGHLYYDLPGAKDAADRKLWAMMGIRYEWDAQIYCSMTLRGIIHRGTRAVSGIIFTVDILERSII